MDEAVFRNINACKELSRVTRSSYGPNGMNKMVINHLEKLFVTNDAATIIKELDVEHPAAKMIVMATKMMEQEVTRLIQQWQPPRAILLPCRWGMGLTLCLSLPGHYWNKQRSCFVWDFPQLRS